jgi:uncharacterized membrane protein
MQKTDDEWTWKIIILIWKWKKLLSLQKNERSITLHCDNRRSSNAFRWRRLCKTKWWIRRQYLLFIELIQFRAKNENESDNENENENENENDENENKQYRNKFNINIKINDAKCKNDVNRLHFMKLKKLQNISFAMKNFSIFFFSKCELDKQCCLFESRQARIFLFVSINKCQYNRKMMST